MMTSTQTCINFCLQVSDTGQMKQLEDAIDPYLPSTKPDAAGMNGNLTFYE